jgi:hypothetical protein
MRSLRKKISALSPVLILVPVLCGIVRGQSPLTTIQDTLFNADGARYNGTLSIQWSTFDTSNPGTIVQQSKTVQVTNGNLLLQLAPNSTAAPPANLYTIRYQSDGNQQYTETWTVPSSSSPLKVAQVRTGAGVTSGGGGGGGTPGGSAGQIQYNSAGVFEGFTPSVNGAGLTTPAALNFMNSQPFNGLTLSFANPSGGGVQLGASGTLNNSGLTNSSMTFSLPAWLTGGGSVALGGTLAIGTATQSANSVFAGPPSGSSAAPTFRSLLGTDLPLPTASSLGGVQSIASTANNWISSIDTNGAPHQSQPAFSNLSGSAACGQLPSLTGDTTSSAGSCGTTTGKVNGVSYPSSPAANTVPVVTATNTVTYEAVPNSALANSSVTINGTNCTLGAACALPSPWSRYAVIYGSSTFSVVTVTSSLAAAADQNDIEPCSGYTSSAAHSYVVAYDSASTFKWNVDGGSFTTGVAITGSSTCQTLSNGFRVSFGHSSGYTTGDSNMFALAAPSATAAALTQNVTLTTPSPKSVVEAVVMYQPSAFAGTGISTLTFSIGRNGTETDFAQPQCLISGTCGTVLGTSSGPIYSGGGANILNMASQPIVGQFTAIGANLSALSAGVLDIWLKESVLP